MSLFSSSNYAIESQNPFRLAVANSKGRLLLPLLVFVLLLWGYVEISLAGFLVRLVFALFSGHTVLIGLGQQTSNTVALLHPILWGGMFLAITLILIATAFLGWFLIEEALWRFIGRETVEITKDRIVWSHRTPFFQHTKIYPTTGLQSARVWKPDFVSKLDQLRPMLVTYRGMGNGAIALDYGTQTTQIGSLITSTDAQFILAYLQRAYHLQISVET